MHKNLENFPSINYISLYESVDRRQRFQKQLKKLGITRSTLYLTDRLSKFRDSLIIEVDFAENLSDHIMGVTISHLNMLRNWYTSCNEPYAIFCEDDVNFASVDYWNFTWNDFICNLPQDWECVQLMRMGTDPNGPKENQYFNLNLTFGRWWGSHSLMKRSYVKKILDKFVKGHNHYHFKIYNNQENVSYYPIAENVLFLSVGSVWNFPLLVEFAKNTSTNPDAPIIPNNVLISHKRIMHLWKTHGLTLDIKQALTV
jgi:GR25 family glycosyltransferase involved in LPS biosynthesis